MHIEIRKGMNLYPGTFNAVIAPEKLMISAINGNVDLQRFLFLYVCGNYSRILTGVNRTSGNFDVRRAFTAHQLFSVIKEAGYTIILVEHDPSLFDGAEEMLDPVSGALKDAGCDSLVILYTPVIDRTFSSLIRRADRIIEIVSIKDLSLRDPIRSIRMQRNCGTLLNGQRTLEVS
jgi:DNA polymerase I